MMEGFFEWMLEASLLVGMILVIRKVFMGKIRYGLIYALWGIVLLRFLIPGNMIATPFSIENILSKTSSGWETEELQKQEKGNQRSIKGALLEERERGMLLSEGSDKAVLGKKQQENEFGNFEKNSSFVEQENTVLTLNENKDNEQTGSVSWHKLWPVIWFSISVLLFFWLLFSNVALLRKMKKNRILYGKKGIVKIYAVCGIQNPCLYGFFRPSIYLPFSLVLAEGKDRVNKEELEQIITHEFIHYRHRDHIWAMLRMLLVSVYWFQPFAWIAASCSKKDAELFCDETVIHFLGEEKRFSYGEMLVRLAGKPGWGDFRYSMLQMSKKGKEMERRIRAISGKRRYSKWMILPLMAALCVAIGITCSAGMDSMAEQKQETVKEKQDSKDQAVQKNNARVESSGLWQENAGKNGYLYSSFAWLEKALQKSGSGFSVFSSFLEGDDAKNRKKVPTSQNEQSNTPEEAFDQYMRIFTNAVNTGNTNEMDQVLAQKLYTQQCNIAQNYYKRSIREKVKSYSVSVAEKKEGCVKIDSKEKIRVFHADGKSRIVKQSYRYTCKQNLDGKDGWVITDMQEI